MEGMTRLEKILACIDVRTQVGLEVGPLFNPIVTRDMGQIYYIDHATTAELQVKYAHDPNVDIHKIVDVDYVWGKETLPELVGKNTPFDYLVASHVVEHVPDFIGWLQEIHAVLKVGGILSLIIPDKRYCFDYDRQPTQVADVVEAFLLHSRKPSPRQVFEHFTSAVTYDGNIVWDSSTLVDSQKLQRIHSPQDAWELAQRSLFTDQYIDAHCWVFTPQFFFDLLRSLIQMNLLGFKVEQFYETTGCEFYVSLKTLDLQKMSVSDRQSLQLASLPSHFEATDSPPLIPLPSCETHLTPQQIQKLQRKTDNQANKIQRLTLRLEEAQQQINTLQNSRSWKITAPLRWIQQQAFKPQHKA